MVDRKALEDNVVLLLPEVIGSSQNLAPAALYSMNVRCMPLKFHLMQHPLRHHAVSIHPLPNWKSGTREVAEGVTEEDAYHPVKMILRPCFHPLLRYWTTAPQYPKTLALHQSSLRLDAVRPSTTVVACSSILSVVGGYDSVSSLAGTPRNGRERCVDCDGPFPGLDDPLSGPSAAWSDNVAAVCLANDSAGLQPASVPHPGQGHR